MAMLPLRTEGEKEFLMVIASMGLDVLKELKRSHPGLPRLELMMCPEDQFAAQPVRAGAPRSMTKESAPQESGKAV